MGLPITNLSTGTLQAGLRPDRDELLHIWPSHLHDVGEVDDATFGGGRAVLVTGEVDDDFAAFRRPQLERVALDRERQEPTIGDDLHKKLHALLTELSTAQRDVCEEGLLDVNPDALFAWPDSRQQLQIRVVIAAVL